MCAISSPLAAEIDARIAERTAHGRSAMDKTRYGFLVLILLVSSRALTQTAAPRETYLKDATIAESAGTVRIVANSPRPMEQVLDALQRKYGWTVNYEDPQYISTADYVETEGAEHSRIPGGRSFSVEFPTGSAEEKVLRLVVDAYNKSSNPGHFEVRQLVDGSFDVVGTEAHDQKGRILPQQVPLDLSVTLSTEELPIDETVNRICAEVTKQLHFDFNLGISPRSFLLRTTAKIGGTNKSAREFLSQSLTATHQKLYWRLLFDPNSKTYLLNLHAVHS
jgi:hypothetical protein